MVWELMNGIGSLIFPSTFRSKILIFKLHFSGDLILRKRPLVFGNAKKFRVKVQQTS